MNRPVLVTAGSTISAAEHVVTYLKQLEGNGVAQANQIERHIGRFNEVSEVKRYLSGKNGSIRVCALRVTNIQQQAGGVIGNVDFAAYIMTTDHFGYSRDTRAEVITGLVTRLLCRRTAGKEMQAEAAPREIRADNLYSGNIDDLGVCIWCVTWSQLYRTDEDIDISTLDDFLILGLNAPSGDGSPSLDAEIHVREVNSGN